MRLDPPAGPAALAHVDDLAEGYVARLVANYTRLGLPQEALAGAMLAAAVNLLVDDLGAEDASALLAGLAHQIFSPEVRGHA